MDHLFSKEVFECGKELSELTEKNTKSIFNKDWWYGRIMEWSMQNEDFKVQMFRFVDVLPYLNSSSEIYRHLEEYFSKDTRGIPSFFNTGLGLGKLTPALVANAVKKNVTEMARLFITGETPKEALKVLEKKRKAGIGFTVALLGEATLSEKESVNYQDKYTQLIRELVEAEKSWPHVPQIDERDGVKLPRSNVSVKLSAIESQINEADWDQSKEKVKNKLRPILQLAKDNSVFIYIDMEAYNHKKLTIEIFKEIINEPEFKNYPHFGIIIQAYLKDSYKDLEELCDFARERGAPFTIRLVKGAYWEYEVIHADQQNWEVPVYEIKAEADANFEACTRLLVDNHKDVHLALGTHNLRSIAHAITYVHQKGLSPQLIEFQGLYGMADEIKFALASKGYRVREYATVAQLIPGMAYLVRRLLENTSSASFLRNKFVEKISLEALLEDPRKSLERTLSIQKEQQSESKKRFTNYPLLDFGKAPYRDHLKNALQKISKKKFHYSPIINGKKVIGGQKLNSLNPTDPDQVLGTFECAHTKDAEEAVQGAKAAFPDWNALSFSERADYLEAIASEIEKRKYEIMALEILEVGKTWPEADGDICEALDFCRYYAKEARQFDTPTLVGEVKGEVSEYLYRPRGVSLVIAPWNFPLAILTGMVAASLVTGNTVLMKPAEQSTLTAGMLAEIIEAVKLPKGVVQFLPGLGEEIGEYLTSHKDVDIICFTGSKEVGLQILKKSSQVLPGQKNIKKCIIEMGGKNSIIIDSDADLDQAVAGVVQSAFYFQGQKCSACSRAIVLEDNYDKFIERLVETTKSLKVGVPSDPETKVGPVIDEQAQRIILDKIAHAQTYATLAHTSDIPSKGYFIPPTIFTDVKGDMEIAQFELFGPVLAVIKVKDLEEALQLANQTEYGLTGGIYSRSPANIQKVKNNLIVGNLYVNRSITGAMVDRHPFGGLKMSGVGSKTGGPDYLKQFMEPQAFTENTMRCGFAPETSA